MALTDYDRLVFTSYTHAIVHAAAATYGAWYGMFYANGKPGTCYFDDLESQKVMYDSQKYFNAMTGGYLLYDIIFCMCVFKNDNLMK